MTICLYCDKTGRKLHYDCMYKLEDEAEGSISTMIVMQCAQEIFEQCKLIIPSFKHITKSMPMGLLYIQIQNDFRNKRLGFIEESDINFIWDILESNDMYIMPRGDEYMGIVLNMPILYDLSQKLSRSIRANKLLSMIILHEMIINTVIHEISHLFVKNDTGDNHNAEFQFIFDHLLHESGYNNHMNIHYKYDKGTFIDTGLIISDDLLFILKSEDILPPFFKELTTSKICKFCKYLNIHKSLATV